MNFLITGTDKNGNPFKIHTETPWHYNIWKGTIWKLIEGKKKLVKRINW